MWNINDSLAVQPQFSYYDVMCFTITLLTIYLYSVYNIKVCPLNRGELSMSDPNGIEPTTTRHTKEEAFFYVCQQALLLCVCMHSRSHTAITEFSFVPDF